MTEAYYEGFTALSIILPYALGLFSALFCIVVGYALGILYSKHKGKK